jgi:hypothetical protein
MDFIAQKDLISGLAIFYPIKQHPWQPNRAEVSIAFTADSTSTRWRAPDGWPVLPRCGVDRLDVAEEQAGVDAQQQHAAAGFGRS